MSLIRKLKWLFGHETFKKRPLEVLLGVARWEYHRVTGAPATLTLGDARLLARPIDGNGRMISYFGDEFDDLFDFMTKYLSPGMTYVDVGANIGSHVVNAARIVSSEVGGQVYAFEADPETFVILEKNIALNKLRAVDARNICVTAEEGEVTLFLNRDSAKNSTVRSSGRAVKMPGIPLSKLLPKGASIDLLKIDVEGADLDVLRGAKGIFETSPPAVVVIEAYDVRTGRDNSAGISQFLIEHGYSMNQYAGGVLIPIAAGSVTPNAYAVHARSAQFVSARLKKSV